MYILLLTAVLLFPVQLAPGEYEPQEPIAYKAVTPHYFVHAQSLAVRMGIQNYIVDKAVENGVDPSVALDVVECESNFKADAWNLNDNGTYDVGIWQINDTHGFTWEQRQDPYWATDWAIPKLKEHPEWWVCHTLLYGS